MSLMSYFNITNYRNPLDVVFDAVDNAVRTRLSHDIGGDIQKAVDCVNPWSDKTLGDRAYGLLIQTPVRVNRHVNEAIERSAYPNVLYGAKYVGSTVVAISATAVLTNTLAGASPESFLCCLYTNQPKEAERITKELGEVHSELSSLVSCFERDLKTAGVLDKETYSGNLLEKFLELAENKEIWKNSKNWPLVQLFNERLPEIETTFSKLLKLQNEATAIFRNTSTKHLRGFTELTDDFFCHLGYANSEENKLNAICRVFKGATEIVKNILTSNIK